MFDPIREFTGLISAARSARFSNPALAQQVSDIDKRSRGAKSGDAQAWVDIYEQSLDLIDCMLAEIEEAKKQQAPNRPPMDVLRDVNAAVQDALNRCTNDWPARLASQEQELLQKVERSVDKLEIVGEIDPESGETVFMVPSDTMQGFSRWFDGVLRTWMVNDAELAKVRTEEMILPLLEPAKNAVDFEISVPSLRPPVVKPLTSPRAPVVMPGRWSVLGRTYKTVFGGVTALTTGAFMLSKVFGNEAMAKGSTIVSIVLGVVLVGMLVHAGATVPKQHRQACARLRRGAEERVRKELVAAASQQLRVAREALAAGIRKHFADETFRWRQKARPSQPDVQVGVANALPPLPAKTVERMRNEWPDPIRKRLAALRGN